MRGADNQQERLKIGHFLAGFVEGEGSFNVSLRQKADYKVKWQVVMSFNVSQRDSHLLYLLQQFLNCGIIKRRSDGLHSFDVTSPLDIVNNVIPFFQEFPLRSPEKLRNFNLFVKVAKLMEEGSHKDRVGLLRILEAREQISLNRG